MPGPTFNRSTFIDEKGIGSYTTPLYAVIREIVLKNSGDAQEYRRIWLVGQTGAGDVNYFSEFKISKASGWEQISTAADKTPTEILDSIELIPLIASYNVVTSTVFDDVVDILLALI